MESSERHILPQANNQRIRLLMEKIEVFRRKEASEKSADRDVNAEIALLASTTDHLCFRMKGKIASPCILKNEFYTPVVAPHYVLSIDDHESFHMSTMRFSPDKHKLIEESFKLYKKTPSDSSFLERYNGETVHFQEAFAYYIQVNSWTTPLILRNYLLTFLQSEEPKIYATMVSLDSIIRSLTTSFPVILKKTGFRSNSSDTLLRAGIYKIYSMDQVARDIAYIFFQEFSEYDASRKFQFLYDLAKEDRTEADFAAMVPSIEKCFLEQGFIPSLGLIPYRLCKFWLRIKEMMQENEDEYLTEILYGFLSEFDDYVMPTRYTVSVNALKDPDKLDTQDKEISICQTGIAKKERPELFYEPIVLRDLQAPLISAPTEIKKECTEFLDGLASWYKIKRQVFARCDFIHCLEKKLSNCPLKDGIYTEIKKAWTK